MNVRTRRTSAAAAVVAAAASVLALAPADAADIARCRITVFSNDYEVQPGQQFVLRGRLTSEGAGVEGATVRVLTYRNGGWERLRGAVVTTNDEGRYRVRVVLSSGGDRDLRVVGNPAGDSIRTARNETVVRVLG